MVHTTPPPGTAGVLRKANAASAAHSAAAGASRRSSHLRTWRRSLARAVRPALTSNTACVAAMKLLSSS